MTKRHPAVCDPDAPYAEMQRRKTSKQAPCVRDVFAATMLESKTG